MTFPEFASFAEDLRDLNRSDRGELKRHILRVRTLRESARERSLPELAYCLNAIGNLLAALAAPGDFLDSDGLLSSVLCLVASVEDSLRQDAANDDPAGSIVVNFDIEAKETPLESPAPASKASGARAGPPVESKQSSRSLGMQVDQEFGSHRFMLGRLLLELGQISRLDLADALKMQRNSQLPVGECLLLAGKVAPEKVLDALRIQQRLRAELETAMPPKGPLSSEGKPQRTAPPKYRRIRSNPRVEMHVTKEMFLGEVFLGADMITLDQLEKAMHMHHHEKLMLGQSLIAIGALDQDGLQRGMELHKRLRAIAKHSSVDASARVAGKNLPS